MDVSVISSFVYALISLPGVVRGVFNVLLFLIEASNVPILALYQAFGAGYFWLASIPIVYEKALPKSGV